MFSKIPHSVDRGEQKPYDDLDPDIHLNNYHDNCKYIFNPDNVTITDTSLTVLSFNIRSIRNKFIKLTEMLSLFHKQIDIITLTETWLTEQDNIDDFEIEGYHKPIYANRTGRMGGGIMIYVKKVIIVKKINKQLSFHDDHNHCTTVEMDVNSKKLYLLNCYRSPTNDPGPFTQKVENIISKLSHDCIVCGDFNINLLNMSTHAPTQHYFDTFTSHNFRPLITKPTRITDSSQTLIDQIWTNVLDTTKTFDSYLYITDISDHLPCITVIKNCKPKLSGYRKIKFRQFTDDNLQKFRQQLVDNEIELRAHSEMNGVDPNSKFNKFMHIITENYNSAFPIKVHKIHNKTYNKPWITADIEKLIEKRNRLFSKKSNDNSASRKYKELKKKIEIKLKEGRKIYYQQKLHNNTVINSKTLKQRWDVIREIINRKRHMTDKLPLKTEALGNHYSTLAGKLADKIPIVKDCDIPQTSKMDPRENQLIKCKFKFKDLTTNKVYETILKTDINKGPGIDNLSPKCIKYVADVLSPHLTKLFNSFIEKNLYPSCFKTARCVPVFKGGDLDPLEPVSYRPISILNVLNKVLEKLIHDQIYEYVEENNILPSFQYGYRKKHNTSQAILDYVQEVETNRKQKLTSISVFMDLSKAFDTVDKNLLYNKLSDIGFDTGSADLLHNYMTDRNFTFCDSEPHNTDKLYNLSAGVPQGSLLGPLLFILYIYDMKYICPNDKLIVYADDTTLVVSGRNRKEAAERCNSILERFLLYFHKNKLSVNASKTKYMLHKPHNKYKNMRFYRGNNDNDPVVMGETTLECVNSIKFLGVIVNNKLTWEEHKNYIHRKVSRSIGIIKNCKKVMNQTDTINMYKTFIQSNLLYAIEAWGHTVSGTTDSLNKLQNKIMRIIFDCKRTSDAWDESKDRIQTITELYEHVIIRTCYKLFSKTLPDHFADSVMPDQVPETQLSCTLRNSTERKYRLISNKRDNIPFTTNCVSIWNKKLEHGEISIDKLTNLTTALETSIYTTSNIITENTTHKKDPTKAKSKTAKDKFIEDNMFNYNRR